MYQIPLELDKEGTKERDGEWGKGWGGGGAITFNISIKGGSYSRDGYYSRKHGI